MLASSRAPGALFALCSSIITAIAEARAVAHDREPSIGSAMKIKIEHCETRRPFICSIPGRVINFSDMDAATLRIQGMGPAALKAEVENRYKNKT
jgi:hypothetical protein